MIYLSLSTSRYIYIFFIYLSSHWHSAESASQLWPQQMQKLWIANWRVQRDAHERPWLTNVRRGSWAGEEEGEELTIISKYNKQKHSDIKDCMTATATATTIASCMFAVLLFYSYFVFVFLIIWLTILPRGRERERKSAMKRFSYWEPIVMHWFTYTESGKESQTKAQVNRWIDKRHSQQQHHHHQQHDELQHRHQHHYHEHPLHLNQLNSTAVCESTHARFRIRIRICICIHIRIRFRYWFPCRCCCCSWLIIEDASRA